MELISICSESVQIATLNDYWQWLNGSFLDAYYFAEYYNGDPVTLYDRPFMSDHVSFRVGAGRVRQLRVKKGEKPCPCEP